MHYYQFNIADYQSHTKHLTPIEDICYRRLLDWQYMHEKPIPTDIKSLCRVIMLRDYQEDVEQILIEFFVLTDDGWINNRAFEEIDQFLIHDEENRSREENEKERKRRHREERKELFSDLREKGIIPKWDISIEQLRDLHKQNCKSSATPNKHTNNDTVVSQDQTCDAPVTSPVCPRDEPGTAITINHKPITTNQEPRTINHKPTYVDSGSNEPSSTNLSGVVAKKSDITPVKKPEEPITRQTWKAYAEAYFIRYGADPVRNATVTGQLAQFVKRIGQDESPHVASFFVHHNNQFYVQKMHTVGLLLADAEKLRTEWATKRTVTNTQARQIDRKQNTVEVFNQLIDEQRVAKNARN